MQYTSIEQILWNEIHIRTKGRKPVRCYVKRHIRTFYKHLEVTEEKDERGIYLRLVYTGTRRENILNRGMVVQLFEAFPPIENIGHAPCDNCRGAIKRNCRHAPILA